MDLIKPARLRKGDLIGLVSPASTPQPPEKIEKAVRYLELLGYRTLVGDHAARVHGYLAGNDEERAADLNLMIEDRRVSAIFALRGGYGTPRLLGQVNYRALRKNPKIIAGFSDITALQLAIFRKAGLITFSSPMPAVELWDKPDPFTEEQFWRMVTSPRVHTLRNPTDLLSKCERPGSAEGILLGGNLALLVSQVGTPYLPRLRDSILFLEEVDEYPYRVDRMFTQLRNMGILARLNGMLLGQFTRCAPADDKKPSFSIEQVLQDAVSWTSCPVMSNFAYGHVPRKLTIPLGARARVNGKSGTLSLLENVVG